MTDSGFGEQDDLKNRSVRVKNLPPDSETQEGLLQQVLEKFADIKRVEITGNQASVELANPVVSHSPLLPDALPYSSCSTGSWQVIAND